MSGLLEQLYSGDIRPADTFSLNTPEYKKAREVYDELSDGFYKVLSPSDKEKYLALEDAYNDMMFLEMQETFARGFQLGAAFILEIYNRTTPPSR